MNRDFRMKEAGTKTSKQRVIKILKVADQIDEGHFFDCQEKTPPFIFGCTVQYSYSADLRNCWLFKDQQFFDFIGAVLITDPLNNCRDIFCLNF